MAERQADQGRDERNAVIQSLEFQEADVGAALVHADGADEQSEDAHNQTLGQALAGNRDDDRKPEHGQHEELARNLKRFDKEVRRLDTIP